MSLRDYAPIYDGDRYCLMCRHVCPVERVTKREATSPHGWALLIASEQRGLVSWNAETVDTLYQCADCGLCQANCATDRPLPATIVAARADVVERGAMPESVKLLDMKLREWGNPYGPSEASNANTEKRAEVGLFVGAATATMRPQAVTAAQSLLRAGGREHILLGEGLSGVYLPYTVGLWDTARELARRCIAEIEGHAVREIVTLTKEDAHAFRHFFPEVGLALPEGVRVTEVTDVLAAMLDEDSLSLPPRQGEPLIAVYHDPCHTTRLPETGATARRILEQIAGSPPREMFWRGKQASPCGAVGGFPFTQPGLARKLAEARMGEARSMAAQILVTDDPQCAAHLANYAEGLPVTTLIELVAAGLPC